jgi:hypothetical protein
MMEARTQTALVQSFNTTIQQWRDFLDDYSFEMLVKQPQDGSWSVGQVYVHIVGVTNTCAGRIKEALASDANSDQQMTERAQAMMEKNEFPDIRMKGPAENALTGQPRSKEEIMNGLTDVRKTINQLVENHDLSGSIGKVAHPGLQYFTAMEWLSFAEMHLRHHFRQKRRIDAQLFPENN